MAPAVAGVPAWTTKANLFEAAAVTLNEVLIALEKEGELAVTVYVPALVIERLEKVAIPLEALTLAVPENEALPEVMARAIVAIELVDVFPFVSTTLTLMSGLKLTPAVMFVGCCPKLN